MTTKTDTTDLASQTLMNETVDLTDEEWEMATWLANQAATIARAKEFSTAEGTLSYAEDLFAETVALGVGDGDVRSQRIAAYFVDGFGSIPWPEWMEVDV